MSGEGELWPAFQGWSQSDPGKPLSAKFFKNVVNAMVCEWMRLMHEMLDNAEGNLAKCIEGLFAIFYINDGYIALHDAEFLQEALDPC